MVWLLAVTAGQTAEDIASKTEAHLRSLRSFQANFKQTYYSSTISTPLVEKGKLYLQKPGWMRWEYESPEKKIFLLKETLYLSYFPEEKQLIQSPASDEEYESELFSLLTGRTKILEHYAVEFSPFPTENAQSYQLKLTPRQGEEETFILLEINEQTWFIQKAILFDWTGNKQEFHFSRIKVNISLSEKLFELKTPPDVEVIR